MSIATRTAEAIQKMAGERDLDVSEELYRLELTRQSLYQYQHDKCTPNAKLLQRMALAGYDVMWILTGGKKQYLG